MSDAWLRKLVTVVITSAVLVAILRVLRGDPAPQFTEHRDATVPARPVLIAAPTDPTVSVPPVAPSTGAPSTGAPQAERSTQVKGMAAPVHDLVGESGQGELHLVPAPTDPTVSMAPPRTPTTGPSGNWTEPIDGVCPPGFPVKAKLTSGIFHVPGGLSYHRTAPDRCYPTPEGAEADGLRAAKR